jgi:predicted nucleic acid-binding protein
MPLIQALWILLNNTIIIYTAKANTLTMTRTVFWDTAAFVALGNRRDALHSRSVDISNTLSDDGASIVTTDAVLTEVINTFSQASWRQLAIQLVESLQESIRAGAAELIHVDETLWQRGWHLFMERTDKDWSLTDCISFTVMEGRDIHEAFTSDRHFEQAGFTRLMK